MSGFAGLLSQSKMEYSVKLAGISTLTSQIAKIRFYRILQPQIPELLLISQTPQHQLGADHFQA